MHRKQPDEHQFIRSVSAKFKFGSYFWTIKRKLIDYLIQRCGRMPDRLKISNSKKSKAHCVVVRFFPQFVGIICRMKPQNKIQKPHNVSGRVILWVSCPLPNLFTSRVHMFAGFCGLYISACGAVLGLFGTDNLNSTRETISNNSAQIVALYLY